VIACQVLPKLCKDNYFIANSKPFAALARAATSYFFRGYFS